MTRQDVTWVLELIKNRDARTDAERDAIDMAIEALREISILAKQSNTVEVVRCKDCRWYDKGENEVSTWSICTRPMGIKDSVTDADYCSFVGCREESEVE